jgi:hypothetical protein
MKLEAPAALISIFPEKITERVYYVGASKSSSRHLREFQAISILGGADCEFLEVLAVR